MLIGKGRQLLFMGAPSHLGCGCPLLTKPFDAPCVDEFVHLLGLIGDLCVTLAAVNYFDAKLMRQMVELLRLCMVGDPFRLSAAELFVRQGLMCDIQQRM